MPNVKTEDEFLVGISLSAAITLIITIFLAAMCNSACDDVHDLQCENDGFYSVLLEDGETGEEVRAKTNRRCNPGDVTTEGSSPSKPEPQPQQTTEKTDFFDPDF